jgi:hypothetical protein
MPALSAYNAGMKKNHAVQYTLRHIPPKVDAALRRKAKEQGVSLNRAAVAALAHGLGLSEEKPVYHDLDDLAGTWVDDPVFDEVIRQMDTVDPDLWR